MKREKFYWLLVEDEKGRVAWIDERGNYKCVSKKRLVRVFRKAYKDLAVYTRHFTNVKTRIFIRVSLRKTED